MSACPKRSCTDRKSAPLFIKCVAKECLNVCGVQSQSNPTFIEYSLINFQIVCLDNDLPLLLTNKVKEDLFFKKFLRLLLISACEIPSSWSTSLIDACYGTNVLRVYA